MSNLQVELGLRMDVYRNVERFNEQEEANNLEPEMKKYISDFLRNGKREGLLLPEDQLKELKAVKKSISEKGIAFRSCLSEDTSHIWVAKKDLGELGEDFVSSLEKNETTGLLKVTTKYPHYYPVIKRCNNPMTKGKKRLPSCLDV